MTSSKIISIFNDIYEDPISLNTWLRLPGQVTIITLKQNMSVYIDKTQLFYISSSNESLYISISKKYKDLDDDAIESEYPISMLIPLENVTGFVTTSCDSGIGTYVTKPF